MTKKAKLAKKVKSLFKGKSHDQNDNVRDEHDWPPEVAEAKEKEAAEDKKRGPILAVCRVCGGESEVAHLRKNGCPLCGHAGLVAK